VGQESAPVCDGYMTVRADEAEFDEKTGEVRPHGNVVVTPI
jgi:lipopolysaccharide export system protein LptA